MDILQILLWNWRLSKTVCRQKLLRLSAEVDDYTDILIVWHPGSQKIGYYDVEHQEYAPLAKFAEFMADPALYMTRILEG